MLARERVCGEEDVDEPLEKARLLPTNASPTTRISSESMEIALAGKLLSSDKSYLTNHLQHNTIVIVRNVAPRKLTNANFSPI